MRKKNDRFFFNAILERYLPRRIFVINVLTAMTFWLSASSTKVMYENQLFEIKLVKQFFSFMVTEFWYWGGRYSRNTDIRNKHKKMF